MYYKMANLRATFCRVFPPEQSGYGGEKETTPPPEPPLPPHFCAYSLARTLLLNVALANNDAYSANPPPIGLNEVDIKNQL